MIILEDWEDRFSKALDNIDVSKRHKAGSILPVLPDRVDWNEFLTSIRNEWQRWHDDLYQFRCCLIVLYDGLAFYEYDENTFWPQFSEAVGEERQLPGNQQGQINDTFASAAETYGLKIRRLLCNSALGGTM